MRKVRVTTGILAIGLLSLTVVMSCKDNKKKYSNDDGHHTEVNGDNKAKHTSEEVKNDKIINDNIIINNYLQLKNALTSDDSKGAADAGKNLATALDAFDINSFDEKQQKSLSEIIETAKEHAEHIVKSDINHQREHLKALSTDVIDMIAITGTSSTLYQQFCPMYDKGSAWLSESKDIKNPYYGSKMLKCGNVQKEIN